MNEQLQINKCRKHERRAQKQLFEDLYVPVFRLARRYVVNSQDTEEVLGNAFVRVFNNIGQFEYRGEGHTRKDGFLPIICAVLRYSGNWGNQCMLPDNYT